MRAYRTVGVVAVCFGVAYLVAVRPSSGVPVRPPSTVGARAPELPWSALVANRIRDGEYALRELDEGFRARNRAHDFVATFANDGSVAVEHASAVLRMRTTRVAGRPVETRRVHEGACRLDSAVDASGACLRRLEIDHGELVEWWENRADGLEHGFTMPSRPATRDGEPLTLELAVEATNVTVDAGARSAVVEVEGGRFRYAGLEVRDARGRSLDARMVASGRAIRIVVDDREASYPIVVDPVLVPLPSFTRQGTAAGDSLGASVAFAGDVNGDGYGDVLVGAPFVDDGEADEGAAYLFLGSASGPSTTAAATLTPNVVGAHVGSSLASAGDVDGDGYADVLVGAPGYTNGEAGEGAVYVVRGSSTGLVVATPIVIEGNQVAAELGRSVSSAGDVNDDGYSDVLFGAPGYSNGEVDEGAAIVVLGSSTGLVVATPAVLESNQAGARSGFAVANAADVDADGYGDIVVGAPAYDAGETNEGVAFVHRGSSTGIAATPAAVIEANQAEAFVGGAVSAAGDVDGDGFADLLVGAPYFDGGQTDEGRVLVVRGSSTGVASGATPLEADQAGAAFGLSVAFAGDVNGDGYGDVVVGAPSFSAGQIGEGRALVFVGGSAGLSSTPAVTAESDQAGASFGASVASAGDVNGDGFSDVILGVPELDGSVADVGAVVIELGAGIEPSTTPGASLESDQAAAFFGSSVALAGDVNGDGYDDVIVGAYGFDAGEADEGRAFVYLGSSQGLATTASWTAESNQAGARFARSVASAGDVNGDGYADVVVGANFFDAGEVDEGRAFVYLGSASGLGASPAWTAESNVAGAQFGSAVASAGDVNGDGFADVVVGAPNHANGQSNEGRVSVYFGSARGLRPTPGFVAEADKVNSNFGSAVAGAGDVDADGFGDLIVGARNFDADQVDEGRAYLYRGGPEGPVVPAAFVAEPDQDAANFGVAVARAGDVNGDGYDDVAVGAFRFDAGQVDEGRVFVFHGSASGPSVVATTTIDGDETGAAFGAAVAGAGDVNGDGFADLVVGTPFHGAGTADQGRATIHLGSAGGVVPAAAFARDGMQVDAQLGSAVSGGGDVNGDGFADVVLGAALASNGETGEGRAFVHFGNGNASGRSAGGSLRLVDTYAITPIAPGNRLDALAFEASMLGSTPMGRARVALELETKSGPSPFDGTGTTTSAFADGIVGGTPSRIALASGSLAAATRYHLRARLRVHPSLAMPFIATRFVVAQPSGSPRGTHVRTSSGDADADGFDAIPFGGTDCDDDELEINPSAPDANCDGIDGDCDGTPDDAFTAAVTQCGVGACATTGTSSCSAGVLSDSCVPLAGAAMDADCDGVDDDCSGLADDDYVTTASTCGVGACASTGQRTCLLGVESDSCSPGTGAATDATCDGVDDDCSGVADDDFVPTPTACGVGACAATGSTTCANGAPGDSCVAGAPAPSDADCDGLDDDCSGVSDEDYAPVVTSCGIGACVRSGATSCSSGNVADSCVPGVPAGLDATCNGIDEDCSGVADEDFVPASTQCGIGACRRFGATTCDVGTVQDSCVAGAPASSDATCDGVDDDCSGTPDEDGLCNGVDAGGPVDASVAEDAGRFDAGEGDSGAIPTPPESGGGCHCAVGPRETSRAWIAALAIVLARLGQRARRHRTDSIRRATP